jgi:hypothetical protein
VSDAGAQAVPSTPAPAPAPLEPPPVVRASSEEAPPSIFGESFDGFIKALAETPVSATRHARAAALSDRAQARAAVPQAPPVAPA